MIKFRGLVLFAGLLAMVSGTQAAVPQVGETIWLYHVDEERYVQKDGDDALVVKDATTIESALKFVVEDAPGAGSDVLLRVDGSSDYVEVDTLDSDKLKTTATAADINNTLTHFTFTAVSNGIALVSVGNTDGSPFVAEHGASNYLKARRSDTSSSDTLFTYGVVDAGFGPPTGLSAVVANSQVVLDWDDDTSGELDFYTVYRSTNTPVTASDDLLGTPTNSTFTDLTVSNGVTYYYAVSATDTNSNESGLSNEESVTLSTVTEQPQNLSALGVPLAVELDWADDQTGNLDYYTVYRSTSSNLTTSSPVLTNVAASALIDLDVIPGTNYYYAVTAVATNGVPPESDLSAEVSAQPTIAAPTNSPNIIFFIVDDQVKEELACYGGQVLTPRIDQLAADGMRMDAGHVVSSVCTPSRYSMFTGRYPGNSTWPEYLEAYPTNRHGSPEFNVGLEDDNMNVGNALRLAGYVTGHVGKLHVGAHGLSSDVFSDDDDPEDPAVIAKWQAREISTRQWVLERGFSWAKHVYSGNIDNPYNKHNPEWTLEAALEFIDLNQDRPFYLHYCTTMMHGGPNNWTSALDYPLYSGAGLLDEAPDVPITRSNITAQVDAAGFDSSTYGFTWMDATLGAMIDKLDALGIAGNTLFVFITDHGTDGKFSLLDHNGTSVPCIIRWPDVVPAGSVCSNLVQNTDMVPTFFEVAGAAVPEGYRIDGTSIAPILSDPSTNVHDHLYFELGHGRAVRTDKWKYVAVRHGTNSFAAIEAANLLNMPRDLAYVGNMKRVTGHLSNRPHVYDLDQLYDLENDPLEMTNLAYNVAYEGQLNTMKAILTPYLVAQGRPFGEFVPGEDSVPIEQVQPYVDQLELVQPDGNKGFKYVYSVQGTPYWWLYDQGLTNDTYEAVDLLDTDGDGLVSWEEYIAGTDPTQAGSGLTVEADVQPLGGGFVVRWPSVADRIYAVESTTNLLSGFQSLESDIAATPPENTYTGAVQQAGAYYRVQAEME